MTLRGEGARHPPNSYILVSSESSCIFYKKKNAGYQKTITLCRLKSDPD